MAIVAISLFISNYSYAEEICLLGVTPSGEKCGQTTTVPQNVGVKPGGHSHDGAGGSWNECKVLKLEIDAHKSEYARIKKVAKKEKQKIKKKYSIYIKNERKAFKKRYKRKIPRLRKEGKTDAWIKNDRRRQWNGYKNKKKKKYIDKLKAINKKVKYEARWRKKRVLEIKKIWRRKCKHKKHHNL